MAAQFHLTATKVSMPASITANQLGESPCWDETFGYLWWIDILGEAIYLGRPCPNDATDFDRAAKIPLPGHRPGFVVPTANVFSTNNSEQCKPTHCSTLDGARIDVAGPDAHKSRECIWIAHRTKYQSAQHAVIWGSQKGLFLSYFKEGAPWVEDLVLPADAVNERGELWLDVKMSAMSTITLNPFPSHTVPLASQGREFRFNDGKVAPGGTLFSGALMERTAAHPQRVAGSGCLLQWIPWGGANSPVQVSAATDAPKDEMGAPKGRPSHSRVALGDLTISNGMGWSSDGSVFFHVDTASHAIMQYSYDVETHVLRAGSGKAFWKLPDDLKAKGAVLDGLCVDDDNHVWVALAGYGRVVRLQGQPKSNQLATIVGEVIVEGVPLVTSCCFGGPERNTLYITTAKGTSAAQVAACTAPDAGCLFAVRLGSIARGAPPHPAHLSERTLHALRRLSTGSKL